MLLRRIRDFNEHGSNNISRLRGKLFFPAQTFFVYIQNTFSRTYEPETILHTHTHTHIMYILFVCEAGRREYLSAKNYTTFSRDRVELCLRASTRDYIYILFFSCTHQTF